MFKMILDSEYNITWLISDSN